ncbi:HlyD family type I secretion periplasmic adaptor subunit [Pseudomonas sp. Z2-11]
MNAPYGKENPPFKHDRYYTCLGWLVILLGVIGFLGWAFLAPLDAGVSIEAKVIVSGNRKSVQPLAAGKIEKIHIMEGDRVQAGQLLVELDSTFTLNQYNSLRLQYFSKLAAKNRLMAERDGISEVRFDEKLLRDLGNNIQIDEIIRAQQELFDSRLGTQRAIFDEIEAAMRGTREQISSVQRILQSRQEQRRGFDRQLESQRLLVDEGLLARNRFLEAERQYSQLLGLIADDQGRLGSLKESINESKARLASQRASHQKELRAELNDTRIYMADLLLKLDTAQYDVANMKIVSPTAGIVAGLSVFTRGGVVNAGDRLMDIVPLNEPLSVEGRLPVTEIDKIHSGLQVELEFMAFSRATTPKLIGTIKTVSADRMEDSKNQPYYRIEINVNNLQGQEISPGLLLMPGMPVTAFIKTGERTLMAYLLKPLRDRTRLALIEK